MVFSTQYYRSQVGGTSVINYCYTDPPLKLFARDVYYFFVYLWALPWVIMPMHADGGRMDELHPSLGNIYCLFIHFILCIMQLAFILALPIAIFVPVWMTAAAITAFMTVNYLLCRTLNGNKTTYRSDKKYAPVLPEHEHEQWVFLNGVSVGEHWMKNNLNRLAITFKRPILGIHNQTSGIIFDVVECLVQRNFGYATSDVRRCYKIMRDLLYDPKKSKVVFILHSQGGIEGGMVLDWLLQEMPQDMLAKLEVYTFGNAANHFNNPHRHAVSQDLAQHKGLEAMNTVFTETTYASTISKSERSGNGQMDGEVKSKIPPSLKKEASSTMSRSSVAAEDRAIGHIEHYAHSTDFVAIWGVLHFATNRVDSPQLPRFIGRLFARSTGRGGHLLNQHYLDGMFPLELDPKTRRPLGADENNEFMEEVVKAGEEGSAMENAREAFDMTYSSEGFGAGEINTPVKVHNGGEKHKKRGEVKVKDLSRLWKYRNGKSPTEVPPLLVAEGGIVRNATL
ncbi:alpha/beta-Hydrolase [Sarocladium implicatum]|nr:alpha/beta-Hydrolase [Sarocladium implicatum]